MTIQRGMDERNAGIPEDRRIVFRIGINLGDIIIDGDDIYGDGVNVAARLEGLAEPGGICASGTVFDQVKGKLDLGFEDMSPQAVKNIAEPVRAYRALLAPTSPVDAPPLPDKPSIAVLPFDNMSGDPEQEFFADGRHYHGVIQVSLGCLTRRYPSTLARPGIRVLLFDMRVRTWQLAPHFRRGGRCAVAKPEWGVKRMCLSCGVRYYDMRRDPILCPKCGAKFLPALRPPSVGRPGWPRRTVVTEKTAVKPKAEIEPEAETDSSKHELKQTAKDDEAAEDDDDSVIEDTSDLGEDDDDMPGVPSKLDDDESRG